MAEQSPSLRCFLSCSDAPEDIALRRVFEQHCQILIQQQDLILWSSDHLSPGTIIEKTWEAELQAAHIVLLCLTSNYFTDTRCQLELELALALAQSGQIQIFLLYLRPVNWQHDPRLVSFPCWPDPELAITGYQNHDLAFLRSVRCLSQTLRLNIPIEGPLQRPSIFQARDLPSDLVARPQVYDALKRQLLRDPGPQSFTTTAITTALRGAGGFGKTTLALSLCHDPELWEAFPDGILWLTLGENPPSQLALVHRLLLSLDPELQERYLSQLLDEAVAQLRHLFENRACLLVLDDVWHATDIARLLEGGPRCARLITTRDDRVLPSTTHRLPVDRMQATESLSLLCRRLPSEILHPSYQMRMETLAQRLGFWPLLLNLANGVLVECVVSYRQPLRLALEMMEEAQQQTTGIVAFDLHNAEDRQQAVEHNMSISFQQLTASTPASWHAVERYLELAIFPEDTAIPLATLQKLWQTSGLNAWDTQKLCMLLHRLSLLLSCDLSEGTIRLHDVFRHYLIHRSGNHLSSIHALLLNAHHPDTFHTQGWVGLPFSDRYLWRFLIWHLYAAGKAQEILLALTNIHFLTHKIFTTDVTALEDDLRLAISLIPQSSLLEEIYRSITGISHLLRQITKLSEIKSLLYYHLSFFPTLVPQEIALTQDLQHPWFSIWHSLPSQASSALRRTLRGHKNGVNGCAITANGDRIVSASSDHTLKIWDGKTGQELLTLTGHTKEVNGCAISTNGDKIVSISGKRLNVWDSNTGRELLALNHMGTVCGCAINANGDKIVSTSGASTLKVWNSTTGQELLSITDSTGWIKGCSMSTDGDKIVSISGDHMLKLWNGSTGQQLLTLTGHTREVFGCAISADGCSIISASDDHTVKVWDGITRVKSQIFMGHIKKVHKCAISADGHSIISASDDHTLKVWDGNTGRELQTLEGHQWIINGCAVSADGSKIVSASSDHTLKLWDGKTGKIVLTFEHTSEVYGCAISADGQKIVSASGKMLKLWDGNTGRELLTLAVSKSSQSPQETETKVYKLFAKNMGITPSFPRLSATKKENIETVLSTNYIKEIYRCAISADGRRITSASGKVLKLWDSTTGQELLSLFGHTNSVYDCAINSDGSKIVSASWDKTLKLWDGNTGHTLLTFYGHTSGVRGCAISPDGHWIISTSHDKTLKLWNAQNGICLLTFPVDGILYDCAFHPDGQHIVACGDQGLYFLRLIL